MSKKKTAFVTFSSKYLSTKTSPTFQEFVSVVKGCGLSLLHEWFNKDNGRTHERIHTEVLEAIRDADFLIAEVSIDSIGVGQQITYALQIKKPTILCMKKSREKNNSLAFLKGTKSANIEFIYYSSLDDLKNQFEKLLHTMEEPILEKFNFIATSKLKSIISKQSREQHISKSELLRRIVEEWVEKNKLN